MLPTETPNSKAYASLCYSLGLTRNVLTSIIEGDCDHEKIERILAASSASHIAKSIGIKEEDLGCDWNIWLTGEEKWSLQGLDDGD
jgi:hypothetical protein